MVSKRKRSNTPVVEVECGGLAIAVTTEVPSPSSLVNHDQGNDSREEKNLIFKDSAFQHANRQNNKKKGWRSLKQILTHERSLPWLEPCALYSCINAPPSFKPVKKYSDISGLQAKYTDPQTKLFYASAEEFSTVRRLPSDIVAGYLALRRANISLT